MPNEEPARPQRRRRRPRGNRRPAQRDDARAAQHDEPPPDVPPVTAPPRPESDTAPPERPSRDGRVTKRRRRAPRGPDQKPRPVEPAAGESNPWAAFGLHPDLVAAVAANGFVQPTDIQRELIPRALEGRDCLGQARTGTGKTAAFALPILQLLTPGAGLQALVLAPTRELAAQVDEHVRNLRGENVLKTVVVYGGRRLKAQIDALKRKPEIAVGTPGRVLDLMRRKELNLSTIKIVVLDEVDRMLDIGFRDDIRRILRSMEQPHQTIFVSATLDEEIQKLAKSFMTDPVEVNVSHDMLTVESIDHGFVSVHPEDKFSTLVGLLKHEAPTLAIVFTNTKHKARRVAQNLKREGVNCKEIHGDLVQERRERVLKSFRSQQTHVLVATDLASRGLDVMAISHIINYDVPEDASSYVHRIGRTARMGQTGYAVTFVTPDEGRFLTEIEKLINRELPQFNPDWLVKRMPTQEQIAAAAAAAEAAQQEISPPTVPTRYLDPRQRDAVLESYGIRPIRRTLGSRFRTTRRRR